MHHPTDRITAFVTPVVVHWLEREIAQWVHSKKDRPDDPSHHERTHLQRSYMDRRVHEMCSHFGNDSREQMTITKDGTIK